MNLSDGERWILLWLCELRVQLKFADAKELEPVQMVLREGYADMYDEFAPELMRDEFSTDDGRWVRDVLQMFSSLKSSYLELGGDVQGVTSDQVDFEGFDGNNEGREAAYARFLIEHDFTFPHISQVGDTHMPTKDWYGRMLAAWNKVPAARKFGNRMTAEDIARVVNA